MRAIWKGAVSFGLVNVPVRVFAATQEHDIRFHQVHQADGGRIRMKRTCSVCSEEIGYDQVARGYESPDGRLAVLTDEDFAGLPLSTGREIDVVEFVPAAQVDPLLLARSYYLEPDARAVKPYALLREALEATDRVAVVKVALRQRESLAVLRVRGKVIVLQTLLWPDEVREPDFDVLDGEVSLQPQELAMAQSLIESLAADFAPESFEDSYAKAVSALVEAKLEGAPPAPAAATEEPSTGGVVDLLTALQRSVERARSARGESPGPESGDATGPGPTAGSAPEKALPAGAPPAEAPPAEAPAAGAPGATTAAGSAGPRKASAKKTGKKAAAGKAVPRDRSA